MGTRVGDDTAVPLPERVAMQNPEKSRHVLGTLAARLRAALEAPLPGYEAQKRLAPRPSGGPPERRDGQGRPAAGLVLLYPIDDELFTLLTVRSDTLPTHGGVELVGALSPLFIPPTGFHLHPYVGITRSQPRLRVNSKEVARILEVPLDQLRGIEFAVPHFHIQGEKVWGATAMVLAEFLGVLDSLEGEAGWPSPQPGPGEP